MLLYQRSGWKKTIHVYQRKKFTYVEFYKKKKMINNEEEEEEEDEDDDDEQEIQEGEEGEL